MIRAHARFVDARTINTGDHRIRARRFVIATGSRAAAPQIPGLEQVSYLTNETLFDNTVLPQHLVIIGGGPIGVEMAQAHRRLGAEVTVLSRSSLLPKDDPDAVAVVRDALIADGVEMREFAKIVHVQQNDSRISVKFTDRSREHVIDGSHLLVAVGRTPNVEDLGLDEAGVRHSQKGVDVDARLRTTNPRIYAVGDVASSYQFTHLAAYHAGIVLRNALFHLPAKVDLTALPWVTYTDPELAQVGLTEAQARKLHGASVRILREPFVDVDRAQTDSATHGFAKIMVTKRGRVLGATIVGRQAGELLLPWVLSISRHINIGAMAKVIAPYPTLSEISKRAAGSFYTSRLFGSRTRLLVRILSWFG